MTQNSRNLTTNLQYKVNAQSVQAAVQANNAIGSSFNSASAQAAKLNASMGQLTALTQANASAVGANNYQTFQQAQAAKAAAAAQQQVAAAYNQTAAAAQNAAIAQAAANAPARTLGNLAQVGIALPGIGFQSPLVVGLRAASLAADKTGASFLELGIAGGLLGAAIAGIVVAFAQFNQTIEDSKQHLSAALEAQQNYYDAVRDLTTQQAKDRTDELRHEAQILGQQARETREAADRAFALEQTLPGGDAIARLLNQFGVTSSAELAKRADELEEELDAMNQTFTRLKQGVQSGAFVFNDLIDAEEQLKDAREKASDAINDGLKAIAAAALDVEEARERIAEIRRDIAEADAEYRQKVQQLAQENAERIRDAQADAEDKRQDIAAQGAERRQEIEQDDAERRADILKRYNTDYTNAVADRDALAAYKAKQTRDEELDKQDKAYKKQLDQLQKQMDKQYAAVDKALNKQLQNLQRQYDRQQASLDNAYAKQQRNLEESLNKALAAEIFANNRLESLRSENAFRAQYWAGVVEVANKRMADAAAALAVSLNQSANLITSGRPVNDKANPPNSGGGSSKFPPLSDDKGNIIGANTAAYNMFDPGIYRSNGANSRLRSVPVNSALSSSSSRSTVINFNPVINGSRLTNRQFERMADNWFYQLRRMAT